MAVNSSSRVSRRKCITFSIIILILLLLFLIYMSPTVPLQWNYNSHGTPTHIATLSPNVSNLSFPEPENIFSNPDSNSLNEMNETSVSRFLTESHQTGAPSINKGNESSPLNVLLPLSTEDQDNIDLTDTLNVAYTLQPPEVDSLLTWKSGTFCDSYIGRTLRNPLIMCGDSKVSQNDSLKCLGSPESNKMATCSAAFLAVEPHKLKKAVVDCDACNIDGSGSLYMIRNSQTECNQPNLNSLKAHSEHNDPVYRSLKEITSNQPVLPETCDIWINKTAYFFHSQRYHIYFRLYSYYNLYRILIDRDAQPGEYIVVRMAEATGYKFENFERLLFPEMKTLSEFPKSRVCFREVVFSPWTYACVMFRCKIDIGTRERCLNCNGEGLLGTSLMTFRTRALQACSLEDQPPEERKNRKTKSIVFVKRKAYNRWIGDKSHQFQRVLTNQENFIKELKSHFSKHEVHDVYMEDIDLCQQMRLAHDCDVYIGVHGAGLVHSWWLQDDASLLELVPPSQASNPSFKTLTLLSGRHYHSLAISGDTYHVTVDIKRAIDMIESISDFS